MSLWWLARIESALLITIVSLVYQRHNLLFKALVSTILEIRPWLAASDSICSSASIIMFKSNGDKESPSLL